MRTLKKSLALVLALVMVLGLGVVGASADNKLDSYTDAGEIGDAYVEAVGVLTGLGIVDGRTDTEIVPEATYNRAEAAKIIAYMLLGKDQADALKATVAPFEDVSVDFWAAGYIAYCAELGIISGMTETTFEPYGTLTGYQWAKMLLVAVGYGKNGEFEGDSWSLNTATVVAKTGLNEGDLAAADHVALRREQAMLFAFNALAYLKQVTYSPNSTNYVYDIFGYVFADGTGTTLGEDVYDLASVEGQIVDNEGMGNANTIVDTVGRWGREVAIDAETGLDLMYHAVRVWYIDGKTNTGVYVNDLAETTVYECRNIADGNTAAGKKTSKEERSLGKNAGTVAYESYLIDNTALDLDKDWAYVTLYANVGKLTYKNTGADTTTIDGQKADNDDIKTDISEIAYGTNVVYYHTYSVKTNDDGEAWYVYPVTTTSGVVKSIKNSTSGVVSVTLTDDTVLEISNLWGKLPRDVEKFIVGNQYTFVLDTHGDVITMMRNSARDLWAFTGDYKLTNEFGDYFSDYVVEAQFVNVSTGDVEDFNVNFVDTRYNDIWELRNMYFDISATTDADGVYLATWITPSQNVYAKEYLVAAQDDSHVFNGANEKLSVTNVWGKTSTAYYDPKTVHFIIASGMGSKLTVNEYDGVAELLNAFGVAKAVELFNYAAVVAQNETSNVATTVFAFTDELVGTGDYVFIPYDIDREDWTTVSGDHSKYIVEFDGAYLKGEEITVSFATTGLLKGTVLERGFYYYTVDGNKNVTLTHKAENVDDAWFNWAYNSMLTHTAYNWELNGVDVNDDAVVVDLRTGSSYGDITSVTELFYGSFDPDTNLCDPNLAIAYTLDSNDDIDCIYVVYKGWASTVTVDLAKDLKEAGWVVVGNPVLDTKNEEIEVTVKNTNSSYKVTAASITAYTTGTEEASVSAVAGKDNTLVLTITPDEWSKLERDTKVTVDFLDVQITVANGNTTVFKSVTANKTTFAPGEAVRVTLTCNDGYKFDKDGTVEVTFSAKDGSELVTYHNVKANDTEVTVTIYPGNWGTYTMTACDWAD